MSHVSVPVTEPLADPVYANANAARNADSTRSFTPRLLDDAGLRPGHRVMDIGCGHGDVSRMCAERVGPSGEVVAIDRDATVLAVARTLNPGNVHCVLANLDDLPDIGSFDMIVGRRVLMYLPDPGTTLRRLCTKLRPQGRVVLQEHTPLVLPDARFPVHRQLAEWIWETIRREGADPELGRHLGDCLNSAGLQMLSVRAQTVVMHRSEDHNVVQIARYMVPRMQAAGVVEHVDIDGMVGALHAELPGDGRTVIWDTAFGAWARR